MPCVGRDTLYGCVKCPKFYHPSCYIPPLTSELADEWVCLMCASVGDVKALSDKVKKGRGKLSERDLKTCCRLLFEMFNMWPESVPFRDCGNLNFKEYLDKIQDPRLANIQVCQETGGKARSVAAGLGSRVFSKPVD